MDNFNLIRRGMWDGPILSEEDLDLIRNKKFPKNVSTEEERDLLLACVELMKVGDFSLKPKLIKLMNEAKNLEVQNACIRVFASVCQHEDLQNANNFTFLEEADEDIAHAFITDASDMFSYEMLPYLETFSRGIC